VKWSAGMDDYSKQDQIRSNFDDLSKSKTYTDENRRRVIPRFDDFYETGVKMLFCDKAAPRVLDLGAGTGLYSGFIIGRYPDAELTLIDFSEEMIALSKDRFDKRANVKFVTGDYIDYNFDDQFDIVISALSIHHLNADNKKALYRKIYGLLAPGGEFLNADQIISPSPAIHDKYLQLWLADCIGNGFSEAEIERTKQSISLDDPSTIGEQLIWLSEAGFSVADCLYKYLHFAVLYGRK
jgi:tRNA (cmo5U34)-methyltransferase